MPEPPPQFEPEQVVLSTRKKYLDQYAPQHSANFHSLSFELLAGRNLFTETCEPEKHFDQNQSYSKVFIGHASLYVLADLWLIDSLKVLTLYKLHKTLCNFELGDENAGDVVSLARYAYSEGVGGAGTDEGIGGLRTLVCQYLAMNSLILCLDGAFMELLAEGGQFVQDFFKFEVQRAN